MDQKTVKKEIVMYMMKYNVPHSDIIEKVLESLAQALRWKREKTIEMDEELRQQAFNKAKFSISQEEKDKISHKKSRDLRIEHRVDTLMSMEKEDRDKIQKETKEVTNKKSLSK